jgi:hypothetical protein
MEKRKEVKETVQLRKLKLFGILGLVSLVIPWNVVIWGADLLGYAGAVVEWHLFSFSWLGDYFYFYTRFTDSLQFLILDSIAFVLVLTGSILLFARKRLGGAALIGAMVTWIIYYAFVLQIGPYVDVPVGALLCAIVGVVSLIYKKK